MSSSVAGQPRNSRLLFISITHPFFSTSLTSQPFSDQLLYYFIKMQISNSLLATLLALSTTVLAAPPKLSIKTDVPAVSDAPPSGAQAAHNWNAGVYREPESGSPVTIPNVGPQQNLQPSSPIAASSPGAHSHTRPPNNTPVSRQGSGHTSPQGHRRRSALMRRNLARRAAIARYNEIVARYAEPEYESWYDLYY